jgi:plastocyanin
VSRSVRIPTALAGTWLVLGALLAHASATPARAATQHVVDIANVAFGPASLTIAVGDTVTWTNSDSMPHTATDEDDRFDSGNLDPGQSFSFTFTAPGTYAYRCDYHSNMAGTIVVQEAAAPTAPSPTAPTGQQPAAAASGPGSPGTQPNTAVAPPGAGIQLPALLMGLGLLVMAVSVLRVSPARATRVSRPAGGWRR